MIRRGIIKKQLQELFKRKPVVNLVSQFGIGICVKLFLKHETLKKQKRRLYIGVFTACADRVMKHQNGFVYILN